MTFRFNIGDEVWKRSWPQQAGNVVARGTIGKSWLSYIVERPDGAHAVILEEDAEAMA